MLCRAPKQHSDLKRARKNTREPAALL